MLRKRVPSRLTRSSSTEEPVPARWPVDTSTVEPPARSYTSISESVSAGSSARSCGMRRAIRRRTSTATSHPRGTARCHRRTPAGRAVRVLVDVSQPPSASSATSDPPWRRRRARRPTTRLRRPRRRRVCGDVARREQRGGISFPQVQVAAARCPGRMQLSCRRRPSRPRDEEALSHPQRSPREPRPRRETRRVCPSCRSSIGTAGPPDRGMRPSGRRRGAVVGYGR